MRASIFSIVAILLSAYLPAAHAAMQDDVDQAVVIIERFQDNDHRYLLRNGDQEHCGHQCRKR